MIISVNKEKGFDTNSASPYHYIPKMIRMISKSGENLKGLPYRQDKCSSSHIYIISNIQTISATCLSLKCMCMLWTNIKILCIFIVNEDLLHLLTFIGVFI